MKKIPFKVPILIILVAFLSLVSCKKEENQGIKNIELSVVADIGVEEAKTKEEEDYQFSYIISIDCDKDGNLYVLDYKDMCVKVFDQNGKFLRKMFREGNGPQELSKPYRLAINKHTGNLFIIQEHGFRMKEFDTSGKFIKIHALPEQSTHYFDFIDENRLVYVSRGKYGIKKYNNFKILDLNTLKIEKKFAIIETPSLVNAYQSFVIQKGILWTCPGDKMEMIGYDFKTGRKIKTIPIQEDYEEFEIIDGPDWQTARLYNYAQPFLIYDEIFVFVTIQDFLPPDGKWFTHPKYREIVLYKLGEDQLIEMPGFPKFDFFVDFHVTWQNRIIITSSGYDLYHQIKILKISE
jgi:hypothetical protein